MSGVLHQGPDVFAVSTVNALATHLCGYTANGWHLWRRAHDHAMTEREETAGTTLHSYHHTRIVEIAGRTDRAHVERGYYLNQSRAVTEVLNDQMIWTSLAADAPSDWWHNTPTPGPDIHDPTRFLSPVTERLLQRAAAIPADHAHHLAAPARRDQRAAGHQPQLRHRTPHRARRQSHLHQTPPRGLPVDHQCGRAGNATRTATFRTPPT